METKKADEILTGSRRRSIRGDSIAEDRLLRNVWGFPRARRSLAGWADRRRGNTWVGPSRDRRWRSIRRPRALHRSRRDAACPTRTRARIVLEPLRVAPAIHRPCRRELPSPLGENDGRRHRAEQSFGPSACRQGALWRRRSAWGVGSRGRCQGGLALRSREPVARPSPFQSPSRHIGGHFGARVGESYRRGLEDIRIRSDRP